MKKMNYIDLPTLARINEWMEEFPLHVVVNVETLQEPRVQAGWTVDPGKRMFRVWYWQGN